MFFILDALSLHFDNMFAKGVSRRNGFADPVGQERIQLFYHRLFHGRMRPAHPGIFKVKRAAIDPDDYPVLIFLDGGYQIPAPGHGIEYPEQIPGHGFEAVVLEPGFRSLGYCVSVFTAHLLDKLQTLLSKPAMEKVIIASEPGVQSAHGAAINLFYGAGIFLIHGISAAPLLRASFLGYLRNT
jgi:hypothetical protein